MNLVSKDGTVLYRSKSNDAGAVLKAAQKNLYSFQLEQLVIDGKSFNKDLRDIYLGGATLTNCDFSYRTLRDVNFSDCDLTGTSFRGATLIGCSFADAIITNPAESFARVDADLNTLRTLPTEVVKASKSLAKQLAIHSYIPAEGAFIGFKKLRENKIAKLQITAKAKRSHGANKEERKCRCSEAKVLSITDSFGKPAKEGYSGWEASFKYTVGKIVKPKNKFNEDRWNVCSSGIHFFPTREEAEAYAL